MTGLAAMDAVGAPQADTRRGFRAKRFALAGFGAMRWAFAAIGAATLGLTAMIAMPLQQPRELTSISTTARTVDRSDMPLLQRFVARDGTTLAFRHYPAAQPAAGRIAILVHGSSAGSFAVHALAKGLAAKGIEVYAPDIRGHAGSGTRGDVAYYGQLEDDLADLVGEIRKTNPTAPLTLLGHSSGGGFALRVAASPIQTLFAGAILLSPYLGYDAPSSRKDAGGWANPDLPRIFGLMFLHRLGVTCCEQLPSVAFAVAPDSVKLLTARYSYRLMRDFSTEHVAADVAAATIPLALIAGAEDELMDAGKYKTTVGPRVPVKLIDGVNHMAIVSDPAAITAIADAVLQGGRS